MKKSIRSLLVGGLIVVFVITLVSCGKLSNSDEPGESHIRTSETEGTDDGMGTNGDGSGTDIPSLSSEMTNSSSKSEEKTENNKETSSNKPVSRTTGSGTEASESEPAPSDSGDTDTQPLKLKPNNSVIKYTGRTSAIDSESWLDWSGSSFEINVKGGRVSAMLSAVNQNDINCAWIGVYVDGQRTKTLRLKGGSNWITLANGLPSGKTSNVKVVKLNEAALCTVTLQEIEMTGEVKARTADKKRKII